MRRGERKEEGEREEKRKGRVRYHSQRGRRERTGNAKSESGERDMTNIFNQGPFWMVCRRRRSYGRSIEGVLCTFLL